MTSPLFFEMDALIKDLINQGRSVFPDADFRDGLMFYDHAEWELALDAIFFSIEALHREVPIDLYEAILRANENVVSLTLHTMIPSSQRLDDSL